MEKTLDRLMQEQPRGIWTWIVGTRALTSDGEEIKFYVNGKLQTALPRFVGGELIP